MNEIQQAAQAIVRADALLIGASNGLSIAEGYHVFANNEMFRCQFGDFQQQYGAYGMSLKVVSFTTLRKTYGQSFCNALCSTGSKSTVPRR